MNVHNATEHLKMVKMVNFMLCVFYNNFLVKLRKKKPNTKDSVAQKLPTASGCTSLEAQSGAPE